MYENKRESERKRSEMGGIKMRGRGLERKDWGGIIKEKKQWLGVELEERIDGVTESKCRFCKCSRGSERCGKGEGKEIGKGRRNKEGKFGKK